MLIVTTFGSIIPTIYLIFLTEDFLLYHKWPITLRGGPLIGICLLICIVSVIVMTPKIFARNVNIFNRAICIVCMLLCLAFPLYVISLTGAPREKARRISCASNLKQIALALQQYSMDYAGYFPQANGAVGLELLRKNDYLTDYAVYACPSTKKGKGKDNQPLTEENVDYVYIGGLNTRSDPKQPLMYDKANNHGYYGNVLFADGTVEGIYGNPWTQNIKK